MKAWVQILLGSASGLVAAQFYDFNSMEGQRCGCEFGTALAWGDFNHDGLGDLAIGMPYYNHTGSNGGGGVMVQFGDQPNHQILEPPPTNSSIWGLWNYMGQSLAAGDHDGDGFDDLAVGGPYSPDFQPGGRYGAFGGTIYLDVGGVFLFKGGLTGLTFSKTFTQDQAGGTREAGDQFGRALAFGDLDGDGRDDLVVGAPYEDIGSHNDAGAVSIFYGLPSIRSNSTVR